VCSITTKQDRDENKRAISPMSGIQKKFDDDVLYTEKQKM